MTAGAKNAAAFAKSKTRTKTIVYPRQIAMYLSRTLLNSTFPEIGEKFGGKDHTTVMHSINKIEELVKNDENIKKSIESITKLIQR